MPDTNYLDISFSLKVKNHIPMHFFRYYSILLQYTVSSESGERKTIALVSQIVMVPGTMKLGFWVHPFFSFWSIFLLDLMFSSTRHALNPLLHDTFKN